MWVFSRSTGENLHLKINDTVERRFIEWNQITIKQQIIYIENLENNVITPGFSVLVEYKWNSRTDKLIKISLNHGAIKKKKKRRT